MPKLGLDSDQVTEAYKHNHHNAKATARELRCTERNVRYHLKRAKTLIFAKSKQTGFALTTRTQDITGQKFGFLTALRPEGRTKFGHMLWACSCVCGNEVRRELRVLQKGSQRKDKSGTPVPSCGCARKGVLNPLYKGEGNLSRRKWHSIRGGARKRNLSFEITIQYAWQLFLSQDRRCALTGIPLVLPPFANSAGPNTASLDRIDSAKGYVVGNVQWVHPHVNLMKRELPLDEFITLCHLVVIQANTARSKQNAIQKNSLERLEQLSYTQSEKTLLTAAP